jgi:RHS repeat-associated protein
MKLLVILLVLVLLPSISAKEVSIPELFEISKQVNVPLGSYEKEVYYYAGSKLIAVNDEYKYQDRLGSDVESQSLPFGQQLEIENRFSFTGKELDKDLHYFNARYYDSNLGKFTSVDPIKDNHAYVYVRNNPMNFIDPSGELPIGVDIMLKNLGEQIKILKQSPYRFVERNIRDIYQYDYTNYWGYRSSICSLACAFSAIDSVGSMTQSFDKFITGGIQGGVVDKQQGLVSYNGLADYIEDNFKDIDVNYLQYTQDEINSLNYFWDLEKRLKDGQIIILNVANLKGVPDRGLAYRGGHYLVLTSIYLVESDITFRVSDPARGERYYLTGGDFIEGWGWKGFRGFTLENTQGGSDLDKISASQDSLGPEGSNYYDSIFEADFDF